MIDVFTQVTSCTWMYIRTVAAMDQIILDFVHAFERLQMDTQLDSAPHCTQAHMQRCKLQLTCRGANSSSYAEVQAPAHTCTAAQYAKRSSAQPHTALEHRSLSWL